MWVTLCTALHHMSHIVHCPTPCESHCALPYTMWVTLCTALHHASHIVHCPTPCESHCALPYTIWVTLCTALHHVSHIVHCPTPCESHCALPYTMWVTLCTALHHTATKEQTIHVFYDAVCYNFLCHTALVATPAMTRTCTLVTPILVVVVVVVVVLLLLLLLLSQVRPRCYWGSDKCTDRCMYTGHCLVTVI